MFDLLKLLVSFALIVFLLRRKIRLGIVMLSGSITLAILYLMRPLELAETVFNTFVEPITLKLIVVLTLIRMLETILREHDILSRMMEAFKDMFGNLKAIIISMPLLIGVLPSVGGAYFSCPMVDEATKNVDMKPDEKAFVNYWFRHPWEFILPMYPGILLASALSGMELRSLMLANLPYAVLMILGGFAFSMRGVRRKPSKRTITKEGARSFLPIALILLAVVVLGVELYISLLVVVAGLFVIYGYGFKGSFRVLRHGLTLDVVMLITGVMLFKGVMEATGAVVNISTFFADAGIPLLPTLFLLPMLVGILTGLTIGFVGATFPLITSLAGGDTLAALTFAFASGFVGVLLSPVHVCLILTREYFKAEMGAVYRRMAIPLLLIMLVALAEYFVLL